MQLSKKLLPPLIDFLGQGSCRVSQKTWPGEQLSSIQNPLFGPKPGLPDRSLGAQVEVKGALELAVPLDDVL